MIEKVGVVSFVMLSVSLVPVSLVDLRSTVTLDKLVTEANVKVNGEFDSPTLPAASIWRTNTLFAPSPVTINEVPEPRFHPVLLTLYSQ